MTKSAGIGGGALLASLAVLTGCGSAPPGPLDGDCNARITFRGNTFRPINEVENVPVQAARLGSGQVVGCDLEPVDRVAIHRVRGVDPALAIAVTGQWRAVYVREGTKPTDWPALLATTHS